MRRREATLPRAFTDLNDLNTIALRESNRRHDGLQGKISGTDPRSLQVGIRPPPPRGAAVGTSDLHQM
jgi:hypothetical protein